MKFLVFQHVPHEHLGLIGDYLKSKNIAAEIIEFWKPYEIPDIGDFDALIIMGGPMGVYEGDDVFPSKKDEVKVIKKAIKNNVPTIGFCLGSQLIAKALGSSVYPNIQNGKKVKEIGYYNVDLTAEGAKDQIFQNITSPVNVLQWHGDIFDLPKNAVSLASSPACQYQAFRYGKSTYGMLFHNEFTPEMVSKLIEIDQKWTHDDFDLDEEKLKQESKNYSSKMKGQCTQLFDNFLSIITIN